MRIGYLVRALPQSPRSGESIRDAKLIIGLAKRADEMSVLALDALDHGQPPSGVAGAGVEVAYGPRVSRSARRRAARAAAGLVTRRPLTTSQWGLRGSREAFLEWQDRVRPDVLVVSQHPAWDACHDLFRGLVVFDSHNFETGRLRRIGESFGGVRGMVAEFDSVRMRRLESDISQHASSIIAVTHDDARQFERLGASDVLVLPNGYQPVEHTQSFTDIDRSGLLFVGSLSYSANIQGVVWFLSEVMDLLPKAYVLTIVGSNPSPRTRRLLTSFPRVELRFDVDSVAEHLRQASILIVPLLTGGGSRLKILEAAEERVPVVSTSVGNEGSPLRAGREIEIADSPEEFALAITKVGRMTGAERVERVERARQRIQGLDWDSLSERLYEHLASIDS